MSNQKGRCILIGSPTSGIRYKENVAGFNGPSLCGQESLKLWLDWSLKPLSDFCCIFWVFAHSERWFACVGHVALVWVRAIRQLPLASLQQLLFILYLSIPDQHSPMVRTLQLSLRFLDIVTALVEDWRVEPLSRRRKAGKLLPNRPAHLSKYPDCSHSTEVWDLLQIGHNNSSNVLLRIWKVTM